MYQVRDVLFIFSPRVIVFSSDGELSPQKNIHAIVVQNIKRQFDLLCYNLLSTVRKMSTGHQKT